MKNITHYNFLSIEVKAVILTKYFVVGPRSNTMHIYGCCRQTKPRSVPIRLFDTKEELIAYAGRPLTMCKACQKRFVKMK